MHDGSHLLGTVKDIRTIQATTSTPGGAYSQDAEYKYSR